MDHLLCTDEQHDVEGAEPQPPADAPAPQHTREAAPAGAEAANAQPDVVPPGTFAEAAAPPAADVPDDEWAEQTGRRPISAFEKVASATLMLARVKTSGGNHVLLHTAALYSRTFQVMRAAAEVAIQPRPPAVLIWQLSFAHRPVP